MSRITIEMHGVERINTLVYELGKVDESKAIRYGLLQGAKVIARAGRISLGQSNNEHTGNLMKSIRAKLVRGKTDAYAGFERSFKFYLEKGVGNHAHLVDRGTNERFTKKGARRGIMPASYFWTDAKNRSRGEVSQKIERSIEEWIERLKGKYATP